jgi:secreted trypsin-like serine protease
MAALYKKDHFTCGGVILSSRWVLTAAYCLANENGTHTSTNFELDAPKSDYTIGYGGIEKESLDRVSIRDVRVHPQFKPQSRVVEYNLALIELATPLPSNGAWRPARITPKIVRSGDKLIAIGWGGKIFLERPAYWKKYG